MKKIENYSIEQKKYLDKINELLSIRESRRDSLKHLDKIIMDGLSLIKTMPIRWFVRDTGQPSFERVIKFLNKKYKGEITTDRRYTEGNGYGELHGQLASVPSDVTYAWEITIGEFDFLTNPIKGK